jgi:hypothetical protein
VKIVVALVVVPQSVGSVYIPPAILVKSFSEISDIKFSLSENRSKPVDCKLEIEMLDMRILLVDLFICCE